MADYKTYLAVNVLNEDKLVNYRLLSRALKVHVNTAKEMLYDFHRQQNAKKPGTIHATYLLGGTRREEAVSTNGEVKKDGEDDYMQSSPFMASSMPQVDDGTGATSVLSITLVREEDVESVKAQYESISSIHVYSLGPSPLKDLQLLSDLTRQIQVLTSTNDPLTTAPTYGTTTNPLVKRRTNRRPPPPPPVSLPAATIKPESSKPTHKDPPKLTRQDSAKTSTPSSAKDFFGKGKEKSKPATSNPSSKESTPAPAPPATLKRDSSSIFKAFAKAKPKEKKEDVDEVMADAPLSDDDDEEDVYVPPVVKAEESGKERKGRKEREEELRRMMDEEDDNDEVEEESKVSTPVVDVDEEEEEEEVKPTKKVKKEESEESEAEQQQTVTVSGGRRRGKRRVMKKKTVKDEEGYLVTKEEAVWESFSEDEPAPKARPKVSAAASQPATGKAKKAASGKPGQGNIMSFFGKK